MTPETLIILSMTMVYCGDGQMPKDGCADLPKHTYTLNFGVRNLNGTKDIVQIEQDGGRVFVIHENGKTEQAPNFNPDKNAIRFWQGMYEKLPPMCDALKAFK